MALWVYSVDLSNKQCYWKYESLEGLGSGLLEDIENESVVRRVNQWEGRRALFFLSFFSLRDWG